MSSVFINAVFICSLVLLAHTGAGAAEEQPGLFRLSTQYVHSSGSYGLDSDTTIDSAAVTLDYFRGPWFIQMTVPYVRISGFGTVTLGARGPVQVSRTMEEGMRGTPGTDSNGHGPGNGMGTGGGSGIMGSGHDRDNMPADATAASSVLSETTESGLGDITLEAGYGFYPWYPDRLLVETKALIKLPTADESKGLGTGETDAGLQVELKQPLGAFTPFLSAGYILTGDSDRIDYNNIWSGSVGTTYGLTSRVTAVAAYDFRSKATDTVDSFEEISLEFDWLVHENWSVSLLGAAGLSDAAPDWTAGITAGFSFSRFP